MSDKTGADTARLTAETPRHKVSIGITPPHKGGPQSFHPTMGDSRDGERYRWLKANADRLFGVGRNAALFLDDFIDAEIAKGRGA